MAYNGYYPIGYTPYYPNSAYQPVLGQNANVSQGGNPINQPQINGSQNGIIWVQGEAGAKAYPIAPNTTVQLWDSESQTVYLKSADASGMPSMKTLDYTIRDAKPTVNVTEKPPIDLSGYVTREEFEKRIKEIGRKVKEDEQSFIQPVRKSTNK